MMNFRKTLTAYALGSLGVMASAGADLAGRTTAVRDAATATALINTSRPTQLNVTTDRWGQPKFHAALLQYEAAALVPGEVERHLEGDLVEVLGAVKDPAIARDFRAILVRNGLVSDIAASAAQPGVRVSIGDLSIDTLAQSAGGSDIMGAAVPTLQPFVVAESYGLTEANERTQLLLATTLQGVEASGASTKSAIYATGADTYVLDLASGGHHSTFQLSNVTYSGTQPIRGDLAFLSGTIPGAACFAPILPFGRSRSEPGTCIGLSAGGTIPTSTVTLDLAALVAGAVNDPCVESETADAATYCLMGGRFEISGRMFNYATPPQQFPLKAIRTAGGEQVRNESAGAGFILFYGFGSTNPEIFPKIINACSATGTYWIFDARATDTHSEITIRDTVTDISRTYSNPAGHAAVATTDTSTFTCDP